jgi:hypothetical protein
MDMNEYDLAMSAMNSLLDAQAIKVEVGPLLKLTFTNPDGVVAEAWDDTTPKITPYKLGRLSKEVILSYIHLFYAIDRERT